LRGNIVSIKTWKKADLKPQQIVVSMKNDYKSLGLEIESAYNVNEDLSLRSGLTIQN
jgi:hypothetical protein